MPRHSPVEPFRCVQHAAQGPSFAEPGQCVEVLDCEHFHVADEVGGTSRCCHERLIPFGEQLKGLVPVSDGRQSGFHDLVGGLSQDTTDRARTHRDVSFKADSREQ
jgi:hypothetical protein